MTSRLSKRNPHCESGSGTPVNRESLRDIQRFVQRRSRGIASARSVRLPMTIAARVRAAHSKNFEMSCGECWPSPSRLSAHLNPQRRACSQPARSAAPLPAFLGSRINAAPAPAATFAVSSVEPSSTTITVGKWRRTSATNLPMLAASLLQGITAAHFRGQSMSHLPAETRDDSATSIHPIRVQIGADDFAVRGGNINIANLHVLGRVTILRGPEANLPNRAFVGALQPELCGSEFD